MILGEGLWEQEGEKVGALYIQSRLLSLVRIFFNRSKCIHVYCPLSPKPFMGVVVDQKSLHPKSIPRAAAASDQTSSAGEFRSCGSSKKTISWGCNY